MKNNTKKNSAEIGGLNYNFNLPKILITSFTVLKFILAACRSEINLSRLSFFITIINESAGNIFHRIAFSIKNIQNKIYADHKLLYQNLLSCLFVYQFIKYSFCPKQIKRKNAADAETSFAARAIKSS